MLLLILQNQLFCIVINYFVVAHLMFVLSNVIVNFTINQLFV